MLKLNVSWAFVVPTSWWAAFPSQATGVLLPVHQVFPHWCPSCCQGVLHCCVKQLLLGHCTSFYPCQKEKINSEHNLSLVIESVFFCGCWNSLQPKWFSGCCWKEWNGKSWGCITWHRFRNCLSLALMRWALLHLLSSWWLHVLGILEDTRKGYSFGNNIYYVCEISLFSI